MTKMTMWELDRDTGAPSARELLGHLLDSGTVLSWTGRPLRPPRSTLQSIRRAGDPLSYAGVVTGAVIGRVLGWGRHVPLLRSGIDGGLAALAEQTVRLGLHDDFQVAALDVAARDSSAIFVLTPDEVGIRDEDPDTADAAGVS